MNVPGQKNACGGYRCQKKVAVASRASDSEAQGLVESGRDSVMLWITR